MGLRAQADGLHSDGLQTPTTRLVLGFAAKHQSFGGFGHLQGWTWPPACPRMLSAAAGEGSLGCSPQHLLCASATLLNQYMMGRQHLISYRFPPRMRPACLLTPGWHLVGSQLNNCQACQAPGTVPAPAGVPSAS